MHDAKQPYLFQQNSNVVRFFFKSFMCSPFYLSLLTIKVTFIHNFLLQRLSIYIRVIFPHKMSSWQYNLQVTHNYILMSNTGTDQPTSHVLWRAYFWSRFLHGTECCDHIEGACVGRSYHAVYHSSTIVRSICHVWQVICLCQGFSKGSSDKNTLEFRLQGTKINGIYLFLYLASEILKYFECFHDLMD